MKSSKLNILDKIVRCKVKEEFRDLEFRRPMDSELVIEFVESSSRLLVNLLIVR